MIYNPLMDELCSAAKGQGTFLNGERVFVGTAAGVTDALICNNIGSSRKPSVNRLHVERLHALLAANVQVP